MEIEKLQKEETVTVLHWRVPWWGPLRGEPIVEIPTETVKKLLADFEKSRRVKK